MTDKNKKSQPHKQPLQTMTLEKNGITYVVMHEISSTAKETASQKVKRLILQDIGRATRRKNPRTKT